MFSSLYARPFLALLVALSAPCSFAASPPSTSDLFASEASRSLFFVKTSNTTKPTAQMIDQLFESIVQQSGQLLMLDEHIDTLLLQQKNSGCLSETQTRSLAKYLNISASLIEKLDQNFGTATEYLDAFEPTDPEFERFSPMYQIALVLPELLNRFDKHADLAPKVKQCSTP